MREKGQQGRQEGQGSSKEKEQPLEINIPWTPSSKLSNTRTIPL